MTIEKKPEAVENLVIDLDGPNGNAFYLLGVAKDLCKQTGLDFTKIEKKMTKGDYINLIKEFERYFGPVVTLQTSNPDYLDAFMSPDVEETVLH
jgi:hypothetical protein